MPTVLRLHNPNDIWQGVYNCHATGWDNAVMGAKSAHPCPHSDGLGRSPTYDEYHGFADENQLLNWFPRPNEFGNCQLSIVEVTDVTILDNQAVFHKTDYISHRKYEGPLQCKCSV